ncbi:hypothetical protein [Hyphomicrobium sp. 99]|uniref:hypothetical protein n=1 Tax=Hyphomicrobium sp. 99 TaxID=1163419 RepID=UPI0005F886AE|nr:hypothetical protein [Hyphomicrobium sp. 99]
MNIPDEAAPVIFFLVSALTFAIVLLYSLARAWEQALSAAPPEGKELAKSTPLPNETLNHQLSHGADAAQTRSTAVDARTRDAVSGPEH